MHFKQNKLDHYHIMYTYTESQTQPYNNCEMVERQTPYMGDCYTGSCILFLNFLPVQTIFFPLAKQH